VACCAPRSSWPLARWAHAEDQQVGGRDHWGNSLSRCWRARRSAAPSWRDDATAAAPATIRSIRELAATLYRFAGIDTTPSAHPPVHRHAAPVAARCNVAACVSPLSANATISRYGPCVIMRLTLLSLVIVVVAQSRLQPTAPEAATPKLCWRFRPCATAAPPYPKLLLRTRRVQRQLVGSIDSITKGKLHPRRMHHP